MIGHFVAFVFLAFCFCFVLVFWCCHRRCCFVLICTKKCGKDLKKKKRQKCGKDKPETTAGGWEWSERLVEDTLVSTRFCPKDQTFWNYVNVLCIEKNHQRRRGKPPKS